MAWPDRAHILVIFTELVQWKNVNNSVENDQALMLHFEQMPLNRPVLNVMQRSCILLLYQELSESPVNFQVNASILKPCDDFIFKSWPSFQFLDFQGIMSQD